MLRLPCWVFTAKELKSVDYEAEFSLVDKDNLCLMTFSSRLSQVTQNCTRAYTAEVRNPSNNKSCNEKISVMQKLLETKKT